MPEVKEVVGTNLLLFTKFSPKFENGAIVRLKSGGPIMTVVGCDETEVRTRWFVEGHLHGEAHPINAVKRTRNNASVQT